jgi:hypothetical protein
MDYNAVDKEMTFRLFDKITQLPIQSPTTFTISAFVQLFTDEPTCQSQTVDCNAFAASTGTYTPGVHQVIVPTTNCGRCSNHPYMRRGVLVINGQNLFWNGGNNPDAIGLTATFSVETGLHTNCEITLCALPPGP